MKTNNMNIPNLNSIGHHDGDSGWSFTIKPLDGDSVPNHMLWDIYHIAKHFDWDSDESLLDELNWSLKYCNEYTTTIAHSPKFTMDIDETEFTFEFQLNRNENNFLITFNFKK
jgi:hypothetical protein